MYRRGTSHEGLRRRTPGSLGLGRPGADGPDEGETLRRGRARVDEMIAGGRALGFRIAADNLQHWRDGGGRDRVLPACAFAAEPFLLTHLATVHRARFLHGARKRYWSGELSLERGVRMEWTDSVVAPFPSDLYYALGGFTVRSAVAVQIHEVSTPVRRVTLRFDSWTTEISDDYDWDAGKSTMILGLGRISDEEMLALERAGQGKAFRVRSEAARITDPRVVGDADLLS